MCAYTRRQFLLFCGIGWVLNYFEIMQQMYRMSKESMQFSVASVFIAMVMQCWISECRINWILGYHTVMFITPNHLMCQRFIAWCIQEFTQVGSIL